MFFKSSFLIPLPLSFTLTNIVSTLAIFDMVINGSIESGYLLPATITIIPTDIEYTQWNGSRHVKLTLTKGDVFMKTTSVMRDTGMTYVIFYEFIYGGKTPKFMTYEDNVFIFDVMEEVTGINFRTSHSIFEMLTAMLTRDQDIVSLQYRLTDMKKPPRTIPLSMVSHAALSATGKIVGSYMELGIDSALVNQSENNNSIEDLLRK